MPPLRQLANMEAADLTADSNHATLTRFVGFSVRESAGTAAAAAVNFRHGSVSGQILAVLELAANESATISLGGVFQTPDGVYVQQVSGTVTGELWNAKN
jgi:hypothetical protein